jgi:hypothetical protein
LLKYISWSANGMVLICGCIRLHSDCWITTLLLIIVKLPSGWKVGSDTKKPVFLVLFLQCNCVLWGEIYVAGTNVRPDDIVNTSQVMQMDLVLCQRMWLAGNGMLLESLWRSLATVFASCFVGLLWKALDDCGLSGPP